MRELVVHIYSHIVLQPPSINSAAYVQLDRIVCMTSKIMPTLLHFWHPVLHDLTHPAVLFHQWNHPSKQTTISYNCTLSGTKTVFHPAFEKLNMKRTSKTFLSNFCQFFLSNEYWDKSTTTKLYGKLIETLTLLLSFYFQYYFRKLWEGPTTPCLYLCICVTGSWKVRDVLSGVFSTYVMTF